ncbi:M15 family metallopeptidase [Flectobacillus longus]|uniref:M15 family metallopeptidase n=1 Tax=Flectobacillus longus TaxID=2984207 RepID=UPI0024B72C2F|nr:M15 family metallopeptidase [Flectobacillus longus]MDI9880427.1 M15 family metallopeptidase [Flectobacillus longus]
MKHSIALCLLHILTMGIAFSQKSNPVPCDYEQKMIQQGLINVKSLDPSIAVLLKYSTIDNFVNKDVYGCMTACYLQKKPAQMLARANAILKKKHPHYRLLVYDGGRPFTIQKILWNSLSQYPPHQRETYVASPSQKSIHNYGCAVDLTITTNRGVPLDMGTPFDFFGKLAYPSHEEHFLKNKQLTTQQVVNRRLLRSVMQQAGFMPIKYEWWHFNALARSDAKRIYQIIE